MDEHFSQFKVQNFKLFNEIDLPDLGLFNFIVGDNNVGKTSLLEALLFTPNHDFNVISQRWAYIMYKVRNIGVLKDNYINFYFNRNNKDWDKKASIVIETLTNTFFNKFEISHQRLEDVNVLINKKQIIFPIQNDVSSTYPMPYVYFHLGYGDDFMQKYAPIQFDFPKRELLVENLRKFIPDIHDLEPSAIVRHNQLALIIRRKGQATLPLASFGEGTIKLFRLLMEIAQWRDQRLMIDEIETGVHHSRLSQFLETTLTAAHSNNTQLFATTHSLECLQTLHKVLQKPENEQWREKVRIIQLAHTSTKGVQAYTYNYDDFSNSVLLENEIR